MFRGLYRGGQTLLEIGCGEARRLDYLENNMGIKCFGIEPSRKAVESASNNGLNVIQGTAESLPFESNKFDFIVLASAYISVTEMIYFVLHLRQTVYLKMKVGF
jgi:SAM-dependent methyltransferase